MSLWKILFDWNELVSQGTDVAAYAVLALVGSSLFILKLALTLLGGDADADADFDTDLSHAGSSDSAFTFFSLLSILAFFMGAGWMGLAARLNWGLGGLSSSFASAGFGVAMMSFASVLSWGTRRLDKQIEYDVQTAVGRIARVYLTIPARGEGKGQVEVSVSGRRKILQAISTGPGIEAFRDVRVVEARDDEVLVVEPADS